MKCPPFIKKWPKHTFNNVYTDVAKLGMHKKNNECVSLSTLVVSYAAYC